MYLPAAFAETNPVKLHEFIERNSFGLSRGILSQGQPCFRMFPKVQGNWRRAHDLRRACGQPRPAHLACQAQHVEERWLVPFDSRRQYFALPRARRHFDAVELPHDGPEAIGSHQRGRGVHVLPREEEPHELGCGHRRNLGAQSRQGVAVDACKQPSIAPLNRGRA